MVDLFNIGPFLEIHTNVFFKGTNVRNKTKHVMNVPCEVLMKCCYFVAYLLYKLTTRIKYLIKGPTLNQIWPQSLFKYLLLFFFVFFFDFKKPKESRVNDPGSWASSCILCFCSVCWIIFGAFSLAMLNTVECFFLHLNYLTNLVFYC